MQFRSQPLDGFEEVQGYQADIGAGWWGKLYEENGRDLLWDKSGEQHLKPGDWNHYEIEAEAATSAPGSTASPASTSTTPTANAAAFSPCNSTPADRPKFASGI